MKSSVVKRSIIIAGQRTSVSSFWEGMKDTAKTQRKTLTGID